MAKIDLIREKFKGKVKPIDFIEIANNLDDSKTKKYMEHMVRFIKNLSTDFEMTATHEMEHILDRFKIFDEMAKNGMIENGDLNQYKNLSGVNLAIKEGNLAKSIGKAKKEIKILYEDDNYMLFLPLSYDAASVYGKGTKWCVTQSSYFYKYSDNGILAYFIEKGKNRKFGLYYDMSDSYYYQKLANGKVSPDFKYLTKSNEDELIKDIELREIHKFSTKISCWTDWDERIDMLFVPIPLDIKQLFINYCKENNIQNASLFNEVEIKNLTEYHQKEKLSYEIQDEPEITMEAYYGDVVVGNEPEMDMRG